MPSRTRIVLRRKDNENVAKGDGAKATLTAIVAESILWKTGLPEGWAKLKLREKLKYLKTLLPPEWVLEVYAEPRATRPIKSVYKSQFVRERRRKAPRNRDLLHGHGPFDDYEPATTNEPIDPRPPQNQQVGYNFTTGWTTRPTTRRP